MMKRISLALALALGSTAAFGVSVSSAAEAPFSEDVASPEECEEYQNQEQNRQPNTDPGVVKIHKVTRCGIHWYEAEDGAGGRHVITQVTFGSVNKGYVDFGDGAGGRYCEWK